MEKGEPLHRKGLVFSLLKQELRIIISILSNAKESYYTKTQLAIATVLEVI